MLSFATPSRFILIVILLLVSLSLLSNAPGKGHNVRNAFFRENKGQITDQNGKPRKDILFFREQNDLQCFYKKDGVSYQLKEYRNSNSENDNRSMIKNLMCTDPLKEETKIYRVELSWLNSNPDLTIRKDRQEDVIENYYSAAMNGIFTTVKSFSGLWYLNLYQGIDLRCSLRKGKLKMDYFVKANSDFRQIKIKYAGAKRLFITEAGELCIETPLGKIVETAPIVFQEGRELRSNWKITADSSVSFEIDGADPTKDLQIDPLVKLSDTYFGGSGADRIWHCSSDPSNNFYVVGETRSVSNIATSGAFQSTIGSIQNSDAFLAKFNSAGVLQWCTYYGGQQTDVGMACAVAPNGDVIMVGQTASSSSAAIATPGAHQGNLSIPVSSLQVNDAFIARFTGSGIRVWGTYYGGGGNDAASACSIDRNGFIYVGGATRSSGGTVIATPGSHQDVYGGSIADAFLAKFSPGGSRIWATYYGGPGSVGSLYDGVYDCTVDTSGNVYIVGETDCTSAAVMTTPGSHQPNYGGGGGDGFAVKFDSSGIRLWGTYFGGGGLDYIFSCGVKDSIFFVTGSSISPNGNSIATPGAFQPMLGGGNNFDAFIASFDMSGSRRWSTYYGGNGYDAATDCAIDRGGNLIAFGFSSSINYFAVATPCTYQDTCNGQRDAFIAKFSPAGSRLWGTYYGGSGDEYWPAGLVDNANNIYVVGQTNSNSGIVNSMSPHQFNFGGGTHDGFIVKFDSCASLTPSVISPPANQQVCFNNRTWLSASACNAFWYNSAIGGVLLGTGSTYSTPAISMPTTFYVEDRSCGIPGNRTAVQLSVVPLPTVIVSPDENEICNGEEAIFFWNGAQTYSLNNLNIGLSNSVAVSPGANTSYTVAGVGANGCVGTGTFTVMVNLCLKISDNQNSERLRIYPNPGSDVVTIESLFPTTVLVLDLTGKILREYKFTDSLKIDVSQLSPGLYHLRLNNSLGQFAHKLIVQH